MTPATLVIVGIASSVLIFSLLWVYQKRGGDSGIVDVAWATNVGLLSILFCSFASGNGTRRVIVAVLAVAWALRLSWHILQRLRIHEDGRYLEMIEKWGEQADWRMFRFYQFQAIASVLFALPMLIAAFNSEPFGVLDIIGIAVWIIAIVGEAIADRQLDSFRNNPENKGKVCRNGFWQYSRHPNYFFEWVHWWAYVCFSITYAYGWISIVFPMAMLFFILKVTGIPPTERQAIKSRGDAYRDYQKTTSPFFPWFPKQT